MSALPPKADIDHDGGNVRFVPLADIAASGSLRRKKECLAPPLKNFNRVVKNYKTVTSLTREFAAS
jgi:hypothetical protein